MADTKTIVGHDAVIVLVKGEFDDKPRPLTVRAGEQLPDDLIKGEQEKLEKMGAFDENNKLNARNAFRATYADKAEGDPDIRRITEAPFVNVPSSADEASRQQIVAQMDHAKDSEAEAKKADEAAAKADKEAQRRGRSSGSREAEGPPETQ